MDTNTEKETVRLWSQQLYQEHSAICWQYKIPVSTPTIEVNNAIRSLGSWHSADRVIKISGDLIRKHSWDIVVQVLKHEMAHQVVSEILKGHGGHGKDFHKACDLLGVSKSFRQGENRLNCEGLPGVKKPQKSFDQNLLEKIEKLFALAGSCNKHESLLAMQKANQLLEKYNLERIKRQKLAGYSYTIINHQKKRVENFQRRICYILQNYFYVEVIYSSLYDAKQLTKFKTIELLGAEENVLIAEHVYYFLLNRLSGLWEQYKDAANCSWKKKRSYWLGLVDGFAAKMEELAIQ